MTDDEYDAVSSHGVPFTVAVYGAVTPHSSAAVLDGFHPLGEIVKRTGLPATVVEDALGELVREGRLITGKFLNPAFRHDEHPDDARSEPDRWWARA